MPTISPPLVPSGGTRTLSIEEQLQRAGTLGRAMPEQGKPTCTGQVFVGIFFDGTGNNMKLDFDEPPADRRKHTNIVKLFQTYRRQPAEGYFRFYIPGVGTPFPEIGDANNYVGPNRGLVAAERAEDRIIWAFTRLLNAPHQFVFGNAPLIPDDLAKGIARDLASSSTRAATRRQALKQWQLKLQAALTGRKPEVTMIHLSIFGFSRGAAQARAFANWLYEVCTRHGADWRFAGFPIRVQFLGIFDTVASVGLANLFDTGVLAGHQSWAHNNLEIHPAIDQCVHHVAGHEVRACFPLDSVRVKSSYPANAVEVMYPGAHSDVGGGYAPGDLGVSMGPQDSISIIPGAEMYRQARTAGVPLLPWDQLPEEVQKSLTPSAQVVDAFNAYQRAARVPNAPVEAMHRHHMGLYFSCRFKHRHAYLERAPHATASAQHQPLLARTQRHFIARLASLGGGDPREPGFDPGTASVLHRRMTTAAGLQVSVADRHLHEVAERINVRDVSPAIETLAERHIHDSMAGFIEMGMDEYAANGIGIVKFRTTFKGND